MPYEALTRARLVKALRRLSALATAEGLVLDDRALDLVEEFLEDPR